MAGLGRSLVPWPPALIWVSVDHPDHSPHPPPLNPVPWLYLLFVALAALCCYLVDLFLDLPSWSVCFEMRAAGLGRGMNKRTEDGQREGLEESV